MTKFNPTKSIVAAIAVGALAFAAPAGASVLEPVTAGWNDDNGYVSVTAAVQPSGAEQQPAGDVSTVTALSHPTGEQQPYGDVSSVTALSHPTGGGQPNQLAANPVDPDTVTGFQRTAAAPQSPAAQPAGGIAADDDGFNIGYAAIGAGAALLLACLAMLGASGISRRRDRRSKPGTVVPRAA